MHNKNFSSSNNVAIFNIVLVIINLLASIAEEVLFSFVISFLSLYLDFRKNKAAENEAREALENDFSDPNNYHLAPIPEMMIPDIPDFEQLEKKGKIFEKIMNKYFEIMFEFDGGGRKGLNLMAKKIKMLKIMPWIAINFNIFIQFLMVIFIIIIIGRINLKSDFGFAETENNNQSVQNRMLNRRKSSSRRRSSGIKIANADSDATKLEIKKKKKKKKK